MHRCIASTLLHYDSYIAIFIISAARRCPRSRLTSVVSSYSSSSLFLPSSPRARGECLFFFGKSLPVEFKALATPRDTVPRAGIPQWRTHSGEDPAAVSVRSVVTRTFED